VQIDGLFDFLPGFSDSEPSPLLKARRRTAAAGGDARGTVDLHLVRLFVPVRG
jgi:hypothetical protein